MSNSSSLISSDGPGVLPRRDCKFWTRTLLYYIARLFVPSLMHRSSVAVNYMIVELQHFRLTTSLPLVRIFDLFFLPVVA